MSDVDLIIGVHVNGASEIANLSASLRALTANLRGINIPMSKMDAHTKALNKALGGASKSAGEHAKSLKELARNQKVIGEEAKRVKSNIDSYRTAIQMAGGANTKFGAELRGAQSDLQKFGGQLRGLKIRAFGSDLRSTSMHIQKIGKDAQFVGRSLMINLTAPILLFGRLGLSSLLAVDREAVRLTKVLEGVAMSAEQASFKLTGKKGAIADPQKVQELVDNYNQLDSALTNISLRFGVSKDIVVGLASDFAELGVSSRENITALVDLTTTIEKLGSMDIGPAKDLTQALYFQSRRALEANGALNSYTNATERNTRVIGAATTQLNMFNAIENVTALSLQDLATALPEVGSMAVSFGLSMTEAAALLAPMKAAGLDVGASANSIKVSLQRALAPTKKNIDFLASLAKQYGATSESQKMFNEATKTGLTGLQAIVDIFDTVQRSAAGAEGALFLMSQLFEKRQGPRMYLAIQELAAFNRELNSLTRGAGTAESKIASFAEASIAKINQANKTALPQFINNFSDIGRIARIATATVGQVVEGFTGTGLEGVISERDIKAAKELRYEISQFVLEKRQAGQEDLIGEIKTESGKAFMVELIGATGAADIATNELEMSLSSISVSTERLRNAFKLFASDLIRSVGPAIQKIADLINDLYVRWQNASEQFKNRVRIVVLAFLGLLASLGPLVLALGTLQASVGVLGRAVSFFIPKLKTMDNTFLGIVSSAKKATIAVGEYTKILSKRQGIDNLPLPSYTRATGAAPVPGLPQRAGSAITNVGVQRPVPQTLPSLTDRFGNKLKGPELKAAKAARAIVVAENRAEQARFNNIQQLARAQYLRNEASMLAAQDMAMTKTGRLQKILPTGARSFIKTPTNLYENLSKASALREGKLLEAGISRDIKTGSLRLATASGFRDISEARGVRIAKGGIRGSLARRTAGIAEFADSAFAAGGGKGATGIRGTLTSAKNFTKGAFQLGPVNTFTKSVNAAKDAVKAMQIEQLALGGSAGKIRTLATAMSGFTKATKLGTTALKLMKLTLISSGIGAIILAVGVAVMLVVKNFDKFKKSAGGAIDQLKDAFNILKDAAMSLIEPVLNLFATFSDSGDSVDGVANAFKGIVKVIHFAARVVREFVVKYIQPYMYAIMNIVAAVVSALQGNWGKAFDFLVAAVSWAAKLVVNIFAGLLKGLVSITALGIKAILTLITAIPKGLAKIAGLFGLDGVAEKINGAIDSIYGFVDSGKNAVNRTIDNVANSISSGLDKGVKKGIKTTKQKLGGAKTETKKEAGELGEAIANATGEGFDKEEDLAKRVAKAVMEAAQELQDYVAGELKNAVSKYVDESVKALNKQKESALKVFDVQLSTLTKLEKAEESLTRTKEYETRKRKLIDDQTLSDEQYRRNIAVAIYEGRIDDARMLQLEQKASEKNFGEELKTIESERAKDLAKENLEALKDAINEAKDAASKFFDESIEKFKTAIEEITKFPPVTIQDYQEQTAKIMHITSESAQANGVEFAKMFDSFASSINEKMPNSVIGAFATNLDDLVMTAKEKYGLGADTSENTIIGATIGMLADIGGVFGDRKQEVIDSFGAVTTGLKTNLSDATAALKKTIDDDFLKPFEEATSKFATNWKTIYAKAIEDGNRSITDSLRNSVEINKDLLEEMRKNLSDTTLKWLEMKAAAEQAADAAANAEQASGSGTPSGPTPVTKPNIYYGSVDTFSRRMQLLKPDVKGYAKGGRVKPGTGSTQYAPEGFISAPTQEGVPTLLHGGEYIINAKAVSRIGVGALNKLNNNLIPRFAKGGPVPNKSGMRVADRAEQAISKKTNDALKQRAEATARAAISKKPYDWKKDQNRNFVSDTVNKAVDASIGLGNFGLSALKSIASTATRATIGAYNVVGAVTDMAQSGKRNPLQNLMTRQNDLYYGRGVNIPGLGQVIKPGVSAQTMWNQMSAYEKQTGEKIPTWKKILGSAMGDPVIEDLINIGSVGGGSLASRAVTGITAKVLESTVGRIALTAALGEGGASAVTGLARNAATQAALNRTSVVLTNKNLLGRISSAGSRLTGRSVTPTSPEMLYLAKNLDRTLSAGIKNTYGKTPIQLMGDVFSGRMTLPKGGFTPKAGAIGAGEFIETTGREAATPILTSIASTVDNIGSSVQQRVRAAIGTKIDFNNLRKIGSQAGSNAGGLYQDTASRMKYYLKWAKDATNNVGEVAIPASGVLDNEMLANALYKEAGVLVPDLTKIYTDNGPAIASRILEATPDLNSFSEQFASAPFLEKVRENFAIDAWLGNYDVIGWDTPNLLNTPLGPARIDAGGSLFLSGRGKLKQLSSTAADEFFDRVLELTTLISGKTSEGKSHGSYANAAKVFGSMTKEQIQASAQKLKAITPERIKELVSEFITIPGLGKTYEDTLIARRQYILDHLFGNKAPEEVASIAETTDAIAQFTSPEYMSEFGGAANITDSVISNTFDTPQISIKEKIQSFINNVRYRKPKTILESIIDKNRAEYGIPPMMKLPSLDGMTSDQKHLLSMVDQFGNSLIKPYLGGTIGARSMFDFKPASFISKLYYPFKIFNDPTDFHMSQIFARKDMNAARKLVAIIESSREEGIAATGLSSFISNINNPFSTYAGDANILQDPILNSSREFELLRMFAKAESDMGVYGKYQKALLKLIYPEEILNANGLESKLIEKATSIATVNNKSGIYGYKENMPIFSYKGLFGKTETVFGNSTQYRLKQGSLISNINNLLGSSKFYDSQFEVPNIVLQGLSDNYPYNAQNEVYDIPRFIKEIYGITNNKIVPGTFDDKIKTVADYRANIETQMQSLLTSGEFTGDIAASPNDYLIGQYADAKKALAFGYFRLKYPKGVLSDTFATRLSELFVATTDLATKYPASSGVAQAELSTLFNFLTTSIRLNQLNNVISDIGQSIIPDSYTYKPNLIDHLTQLPSSNKYNSSYNSIKEFILSFERQYMPLDDVTRSNLLSELTNPTRTSIKTSNSYINPENYPASDFFIRLQDSIDNFVEQKSKNVFEFQQLFDSLKLDTFAGEITGIIANESSTSFNPFSSSYKSPASFVPPDWHNADLSALKDKGIITDFETKAWPDVINNNIGFKKIFERILMTRVLNGSSITPAPDILDFSSPDVADLLGGEASTWVDRLFSKYITSDFNIDRFMGIKASNVEDLMASIMQAAGFNIPYGTGSLPSGEKIDIRDIWNFNPTSSGIFPLKVIPKINFTEAFEKFKGKLNSNDILHHITSLSGLTSIDAPSTRSDDFVQAPSDASFNVGFGPIGSHPELKRGQYASPLGGLYLSKPQGWWALMLKNYLTGVKHNIDSAGAINTLKKEIDPYTASLTGPTGGLFSFNLNKNMFDYIKDWVENTSLNTSNDPYWKFLFGGVNTNTYPYNTSNYLGMPNRDLFKLLFQDIRTDYLIKNQSGISGSEGFLNEIVSLPTDAIMSIQHAFSHSSSVEDIKALINPDDLNNMVLSLLTPEEQTRVLKQINLREELSAISFNIADQLYRDLDTNQSLIDTIKVISDREGAFGYDSQTMSDETLRIALSAREFVSKMLNTELPSNLFIPGETKSTQNFAAAQKALSVYLQRIINKYNPAIRLFGGEEGTGLNIPGFKTGGYVPGMPSTPVPAILHGGEYVVNSNAVKNLGVAALSSINSSRFRTPSGVPGVSGYGQTTSVSTVNINVDTFIGEEECFKTMMKSYNLNVLPKNQKLAGNEGRIFTSYNGINQGM